MCAEAIFSILVRLGVIVPVECGLVAALLYEVRGMTVNDAKQMFFLFFF